MVFVRHAQVYDGQHHKDKGLKHDYQNMEYCPWEVQWQLPQAHQGNQNKDQFTRVQVTEQTQRQ